jgi:hypothetical protein
MSLKSRLDQLQRKAAKKSHRGETRDFAAEEAKRWEMTEHLFELTPEDMREAFVAALMEREGPGFPCKRADRLNSWICDLGFDRTILPDDLAPETMRKLLRIYLEDTPKEAIGEVCDQCGLYRPHRGSGNQNDVWVNASDYFDSCPHCGCREWTWSCLVGVWSKREQEFAETGKSDNAHPQPGSRAPAEAQAEEVSNSYFDGELEWPYFGGES